MRFKADIQNIRTFTRFVASLASLGPYSWVKLSNEDVRFTVIPEQGTQVWAVLTITGVKAKLQNLTIKDSVFESYHVSSLADNIINLEVPLPALQRALKTGSNASTASIRLTKRDGVPILCLTITTLSGSLNNNTFTHPGTLDHQDDAQERETVITQDIPIRVLPLDRVEGIHEPRCREPDVNILLPPLSQLRAISDRFTKLAMADRASSSTVWGLTSVGPKLELSANMHGCLRIGISNDSMKISTTWTGLLNPQLNPAQIDGGEETLRNHPTTRMKELGDAEGKSEEGWARVRIDGRDWMKVMSVGRLGAGKVIACFCDDHALILYVFMDSTMNDSDGSVLTYYVSSYSA